MIPFTALHLMHVFSSEVWCSLGRGMVELLLHVQRAAAPGDVGACAGPGAEGSRNPLLLSCRRTSAQPDQESCLRWPKPGTAICHGSGISQEDGINPLCGSGFEVRSADRGLYLADIA